MTTERKILITSWVVGIATLSILAGFVIDNKSDLHGWGAVFTAFFVGYFVNHFGQKWSIQHSAKTDQYTSLYALAEQEVEDGEQVPGLWSRALVKSHGDEAKRKVMYMKLRVEQMIREDESLD